jgi:flavoprotein
LFRTAKIRGFFWACPQAVFVPGLAIIKLDKMQLQLGLCSACGQAVRYNAVLNSHKMEMLAKKPHSAAILHANAFRNM